jgi:hypothetical protein
MDWYYAGDGNQKGPVNEQEFQNLVQQRVVTAGTLVWREGMANWEPYGDRLSPSPDRQAATDGLTCAGCGRSYPQSEVIPLEGRLYCAACKPIAVQRLKEGVISRTTAADEVRNQYLKHEASVKSIGLLYYLGGGGLLLMGIVAIFVGPSDASDSVRQPLMAAVFLGLSVIQFWVGTGVRRLKRWARVPSGILSGIGLLGFPVGTLVNAYILYLIFCRKGKMVFSVEYRAIIEQTPHIKYRTSIVVWILLGLVLLALGVALTAPRLGRL